MLLVTPQEMAEIDEITIKQNGLPSLVLMENAARSILAHIPPGPVKVLVGPGNNGGDGLVIARALYEQGRQVEAVLLSKSLSPDAELQKKLAKEWGVPLKQYYEEGQGPLAIQAGEIIVDALFGTGLSRALTGAYAEIIEQVNSADVFRLAIDIPSGIDGKTGQILGVSLQAHLTVTFGLAKWGHVLYPGKSYCGRLVLTQPGFHPLALLSHDKIVYTTQEVARDLLPTSWPTMHKGDNGRILLLTGSQAYPGAGILSTLGALRGGGGLVFPACSQDLASEIIRWAPEAIPIPRDSIKNLEKFNVVAVGSGLGADTTSYGAELLESFSGPVVVDADALRLVERFSLSKRKAWVLTPHPGELSQLMGKPVATLERDRISSALEAAATIGATICFKGSPTVCATPEGRAYVNSSGNALLAQGGSGDVLAGLIAAFIGFGLPSFEATVAAVYIHGLSADLLANSGTPRGTGARAIAENIPTALGAV